MFSRPLAQVALTVFFLVCIIVSSVWAFGDHLAFGATGDDSPGYIYLGSLIARGQPIVWHDALGKQALDFFGDYRIASWVLPTHHEFIHPDGIIASKYPVGASLLLALGAFLSLHLGDGSTLGMYVVQPVLGGLVVLLTYLFAVIALPRLPLARHGVGLVAAGMLATTDIFYDTVISYPMRELPSMVFLLLSAIVYIPTIRVISRSRAQGTPVLTWGYAGLLLFGVLFGFACTVRETSIVILPAYIVYGVALTWSGSASVKALLAYVKKQWVIIACVLLGCIIGVLPIVWDSVQISTQNEPFKERDTGSVVLLSNMNHLQTVSLKNMFESTGRYRPANGSLGQYWNVLSDVSSIPFLPVLVFVMTAGAFWFGNREERAVAALWGLWFAGTLTMFALWINPYSRYILPLLPPYFLLFATGFVLSVQGLYKQASVQFQCALLMLGLLVVVGSLVEPLRLMKIDHAVDEYPSRTITYNDSVLLQQIADTVTHDNTGQKEPIALFAGPVRFGLSEVFMAQTGIRSMRLPFEEEKDQPNPVQVRDFLRLLLNDSHSLYVVLPVNQTTEIVQFQKDWIAEGGRLEVLQVGEKNDIDFSFAEDTTLIRLSN